MVEVVTLAGPLADAGEDGVAAVALGDVVDQLHDQNGLAHAGTAEQADLTALGVRGQQVDDLDAGHQLFVSVDCSTNSGRRAVDRPGFGGRTGPRSSIGSPMTLMIRPSVSGPTGTEIGAPVSVTSCRGSDRRSPHGDAAHRVFAQVLCHFENQHTGRRTRRSARSDLGQLTVEMHVDDGAHDLGDRYRQRCQPFSFPLLRPQLVSLSATAPRRRR